MASGASESMSTGTSSGRSGIRAHDSKWEGPSSDDEIVSFGKLTVTFLGLVGTTTGATTGATSETTLFLAAGPPRAAFGGPPVLILGARRFRCGGNCWPGIIKALGGNWPCEGNWPWPRGVIGMPMGG